MLLLIVKTIITQRNEKKHIDLLFLEILYIKVSINWYGGIGCCYKSNSLANHMWLEYLCK